METRNYTYHPMFNRQDLDELYPDDLEAAFFMFDIMSIELDNYLSELETLIADKDSYKVGRMMHRIGPSFKFIGLPELSLRMLELYRKTIKELNPEIIMPVATEVLENLRNSAPVIKEEAKKLKAIIEN
jgi:hypothetical protein